MSSNGHGPSTPHPVIHIGTSHGEKMPAAEIVNPREWHDVLEGYVEVAEADKKKLSTLLIDIDALKATNDELGHDEGHRLIDMVNRLTKVIPMSLRNENDSGRHADIITAHPSAPAEINAPGVVLPEPRAERIGGDEFGIILPDTDWTGAHVVADRLRANVAQELKQPENSPLAEIGVGVSVGVATLQPGMTAADLLSEADTAMYKDKMKQLRPLSPLEEASLINALIYLKDADVRPRDVPKYIQSIGATALGQAQISKNQADS